MEGKKEKRTGKPIITGLAVTTLCFLIPGVIALKEFGDISYALEFSPLLIMGVAAGIFTMYFWITRRKEQIDSNSESINGPK